MQDFATGGFWTGSCGFFNRGRGARTKGDVDSFASEVPGDGLPRPLIGGRDNSHTPCSPTSNICTSSKLPMVSRNGRRVKLPGTLPGTLPAT
jgi:hypothetical protein